MGRLLTIAGPVIEFMGAWQLGSQSHGGDTGVSIRSGGGGGGTSKGGV